MKFKEHFRNRTFSYIFIVSAVSIVTFALLYFIIPINIGMNGNDKEVVITYADNITDAHQIVINNFNKEYEGEIKVKQLICLL